MNVNLVGDKMEMNAQYVSFSNKLTYFLTVFMIIVNSWKRWFWDSLELQCESLCVILFWFMQK